MISEGARDWSNEAKKCNFEITINYIFKYIEIENNYFK